MEFLISPAQFLAMVLVLAPLMGLLFWFFRETDRIMKQSATALAEHEKLMAQFRDTQERTD